MASFKVIKLNGDFNIVETKYNNSSLREELYMSPKIPDNLVDYLVNKDEVIIIPTLEDASRLFMGGPYRIVSLDPNYIIEKIEEDTANDILFIASMRYYDDVIEKGRYVLYYYYASTLQNEDFGKIEFRKIRLDNIIKGI